MPPKKAPAKKPDAASMGSQKGSIHEVRGPVNTCEMKILMEVKHEAGHFLKMKYDWIEVTQGAEGKEIGFSEIDTGFLKDWNLLQIEGEEPIPQEEVETTKAKAAGGKKPAADPKKGAGSKLEDINDNRPRTINYERDCALENNGIGLEVTEDVAIKFSEAILNIQVFETNKETQEEELIETIQIDLSCLLFQEGGIHQTWKFDSMKAMQLHYMKLSIQSDLPLLTDFYRKKLNPLQINLVSLKDIPFKTEPKYKPIYATLEFIDGTSFSTLEMAQQPHCRFMHSHVFLVGKHDPVKFRELLATTLVKVVLHDCDEYVSDDTDHNFSTGVASFTLKDFLRPFCRELKLRSDVFPRKKAELDNTQNLDLNTTARKNEKTIEKFSPYLMNATYAVIRANLSYPIGAFNLEEELAAAQVAQQDGSQMEESKETKTVSKETMGASATRLSSMKQMMESTFSGQDATAPRKNEVVKFDPMDDINGPIFERMIIILPYKAPETVKHIEATFERINLAGLNLENSRYLNTKELSEEERADRTLDFLGGFEIMDSEFRMFIIEGLGGQNHGMEQFYRANERTRPNDKKFKMLYNPGVRFKSRMYLDFNASIKKIRLRDPLTKIMGAPDVYLRSKVPEDMFDTLQKFAEIRKLDRASLVRDFNLFPITQNLLTLERKYGDSLNHEDLYGFKQRRKKKVKVSTESGLIEDGTTEMQSEAGRTTTKGPVSETGMSKTDLSASAKLVTQQEAAESSEEEAPPPKRNPDTDSKNIAFEQSLRSRSMGQKQDFIITNRRTIRQMSSGRPPKARVDVPEGVEIYPYGSQRGNIWETQKEQLRKLIEHDTSHFYTYSKDYLSQSFPLVNENLIAIKDKQENESRWKTKAGFDVHGKKSNWNSHPKRPDAATMADLQIPYVQQKADAKRQMKGLQYHPGQDGKQDFQSKVKNQQTFSDPSYFKTVFISGDDMVKEMAEMKQKEINDFEKKVVVDNKHFHVNTRVQKSHQMQKKNSLLQDQSNKIGLRLGRKKLQELTGRQILATKELSNPPVSVFSQEHYVMNEGVVKPMKVKMDTTMTPYNRSLNQRETEDFVRYSKRDIMVKAPTSKKVKIEPLTERERRGPKFGPTQV